MSKSLINRFCLLYLFLPLACIGITVSCSLDDDRDSCCGQNMMRYTFVYAGENRFYKVVSTMEYFLFDERGSFLRMMGAYNGDKSRVSLESLSPGKYTLVGLANRGDYTSPHESMREGLKSCRLTVNGWSLQNRVFGSGDPMYWSIADFEIKEGERKMFVSNLSHIHCTLRIRVEWEALPPSSDQFYFTLSGLGQEVAMHGNGALHYEGYKYPMVEYAQNTAYVKVTMRQLALEEQIISLRYADDHIPTFRLWHENKPISRPIDLKRAFQIWKWRPDEAVIQEYSIRLYIRADGKIEVHQGLGASVNDWIDGGIIGF